MRASGRWMRPTTASGDAPSDWADAVISVGHVGDARLDRRHPRGEEADRVGVGEGDERPGGGEAGQPEAGAIEQVVEGDEGEHDAHRDDRAGDGVADDADAAGDRDHPLRAEAAGVGDDDRRQQADPDRHRGERDAVAEELGVALDHRRAARAALLGDRPRDEPGHRGPEGEGDDGGRRDGGGDRLASRTGASARRARARPPDSPNRARPRRTRSKPMASRASSEHEGGDLARRVTVVGAAPDPEHADRDGLLAEVLHGAEVGERLHRHDRRAGGDRRAQHRHHHPAGRSRAREAPSVRATIAAVAAWSRSAARASR